MQQYNQLKRLYTLTLSGMTEIKRDSDSYHHNQPAENTLSHSVGQTEATTTTTLNSQPK
jgi:hypothetical protein